MVHETHEILEVVVQHYKNLFRKEDIGSFSLDEGFWNPGEMVSVDDNLDLEKPFSLEEVKVAIFS
jgi:hypothetical protein